MWNDLGGAWRGGGGKSMGIWLRWKGRHHEWDLPVGHSSCQITSSKRITIVLMRSERALLESAVLSAEKKNKQTEKTNNLKQKARREALRSRCSGKCAATDATPPSVRSKWHWGCATALITGGSVIMQHFTQLLLVWSSALRSHEATCSPLLSVSRLLLHVRKKFAMEFLMETKVIVWHTFLQVTKFASCGRSLFWIRGKLTNVW